MPFVRGSTYSLFARDFGPGFALVHGRLQAPLESQKHLQPAYNCIKINKNSYGPLQLVARDGECFVRVRVTQRLLAALASPP